MASGFSASVSRKRAHQSEPEELSRRIRRVKASSDQTYLPTISPVSRKRPHDLDSAFASSRAEPATKKVCTSRISISLTEHAIDHWRRSGTWPDEYFKPGSMSEAFARPLRRKRSEAGSLASTSTPSDQRSKEDSTPYKDPKYQDELMLKGVFMGFAPADKEPTAESQQTFQTLLETEQLVPENTVFRDDSYARLFNCIQGKNEARIVQDIARLIVPSAESFYILGDENMAYLSESVNEGWNRAISFLGTRPQPDYSVGFNIKAFTTEQREKLAPYVGRVFGSQKSYFLATPLMYFPFLTSEVKCGAGGLDIADRQNAHSMTLAVRAIVELFGQTQRSNELDREILAISVSHDAQTVRIYGHYPIIDGSKVSYYQHLIKAFDLRYGRGKYKWCAYKFVTNLYKLWVPKHLARLCSAIDGLPHPNQTSRASVDGSQELDSSQVLLTQPESITTTDSQANDHHNAIRDGPLTPNSSVSDPESSKRQKA